MLERLFRGTPGHPIHPPLTDATIGMLVLATGLSIVGTAGLAEEAAAKGAWLALVGGLAVAVPTAVTGFADWLRLTWGSPVWRTATLHLSAMVSAVTLYGLAAWAQWDGYQDGTVTTAGLVLAVAGLVALTAGGWLGGTIVFVHGMRVEAKTNDAHGEAGVPRERARNVV